MLALEDQDPVCQIVSVMRGFIGSRGKLVELEPCARAILRCLHCDMPDSWSRICLHRKSQCRR